jgi:hypothetical protein|tara:strand:+ start:1816 stop:3828 length:2013 start_codon:yes stop_codon:yes gene_type:complete
MRQSIPLFRTINTGLDLNGPTLGMQSQPVGTSCSVASGIATFIGIGTAIFPDGQTSRNTNTGTLTHQWHQVGVGALSDGTNITGSGTTTLTVSGLTNPDDNQNEYFCQIGYDPNNLSPNAINEPFDSASAKVTVSPVISFTREPANSTVSLGNTTTFIVTANTSDNSNQNLSYQWVLDGTDLNDGTSTTTGEVSGSKTPVLTISRELPALYKVFCKVSHTTANPGIITTTQANLDVSLERSLIKYERFGGGTFVAEQNERDIAATGVLSFRANADVGARIITFYSPERDIDVKITMGGAAGASNNGRVGGEGGISVFKTTLIKGEEYLVKLGVNYLQGGGPRGGINGGGGLAALYHKARVIAVCGGGGGAGTVEGGGDGGGLGVNGDRGHGVSGGNGGSSIQKGQMPTNGLTQAGRSGPRDFDVDAIGGGRISGCTIGGYWHEQGKSPCEDTEFGHFRNADGSINSNTYVIQRGFKAGQGFRNNGGAGSGNQGGGGAGGTGGSGGDNGGSGGGGGSGYESDEVTLLPSSELPSGTQLGGNNGVAFISIEPFVAADDHVPFIPPLTDTDFRTVTFTVTRTTLENISVQFTKTSGIGPDKLIFGPNSGALTAQIDKNSVYTISAESNVDTRSLDQQNNRLTLSDTDSNPGQLIITSDIGAFTTDTTWTANWT